VTVSIPPKLGPSKNLYLFTKLRDAYKHKFIETSQMMADVDLNLRGIDNKLSVHPPHLTGAYASLISNELFDNNDSTNEFLSPEESASTTKNKIVVPSALI
jgi:hypothetical protein